MLLPLFLMLTAIATIALGGAEMLALDTKAKASARINRYQIVATQVAENALVAALAQTEQQLVGAGTADAIPALPPAMAQTSICDPTVPCGFSATASYAFDGDTEVIASPSQSNVVTASSLERNAGVAERRLGVTITVNVVDASGTVVATRPQRKTVRLWALAPYAEMVGTQDSGARANRASTGSADMGGCAPGGAGCDPSKVMAADPTTLDARTQCDTTGYGSGTCAPNEMRNVENKQNEQYQNGQAAASTGP